MMEDADRRKPQERADIQTVVVDLLGDGETLPTHRPHP
jgi:hypothetical protein